MANIFVISDTHFGHRALVEGRKTADGPRKPMDRGRHTDFDSVEEHDEIMIARWNALVRPQDKVYHLGDVVMSKTNLKIVSRLMGKKTLILGNHDIFDSKLYLQYFSNLRGMRPLPDEGILMTHAPVHPSILTEPRFKINLHGHIHRHQVEKVRRLYFNMCVENTGYAPVALEDIKKWAKDELR